MPFFHCFMSCSKNNIQCLWIPLLRWRIVKESKNTEAKMAGTGLQYSIVVLHWLAGISSSSRRPLVPTYFYSTAKEKEKKKRCGQQLTLSFFQETTWRREVHWWLGESQAKREKMSSERHEKKFNRLTVQSSRFSLSLFFRLTPLREKKERKSLLEYTAGILPDYWNCRIRFSFNLILLIPETLSLWLRFTISLQLFSLVVPPTEWLVGHSLSAWLLRWPRVQHHWKHKIRTRDLLHDLLSPFSWNRTNNWLLAVSHTVYIWSFPFCTHKHTYTHRPSHLVIRVFMDFSRRQKEKIFASLMDLRRRRRREQQSIQYVVSSSSPAVHTEMLLVSSHSLSLPTSSFCPNTQSSHMHPLFRKEDHSVFLVLFSPCFPLKILFPASNWMACDGEEEFTHRRREWVDGCSLFLGCSKLFFSSLIHPLSSWKTGLRSHPECKRGVCEDHKN